MVDVADLAYEIRSPKNWENVLGYAIAVNDAILYISLLEKIKFAAAVETADLHDFIIMNAVQIEFNDMPQDIYKCFVASILALADMQREQV